MRLSLKIVILIISLTLLFAVTSTFIISHIIKERLQDENVIWGQVLTDSLAEAISEFVVHGDVLQVRGILNEIVHRRNKLGYVYVTDFDGRVLAHTFSGGFPEALLERDRKHGGGPEQFEYQAGAGEFLDVSYPLIEGMSARIHVGIDRDAEILFQQNARQDIILVSLLIGIVGAILALFLGKRLTLPLANLTDNIKAYSMGGYEGADLANTSDTEVNKVIQAFNQMKKKRKDAENLQARLGRILDQSINEIYEFDAATLYFTQVNRGARENLGYSMEELKDMTPVDIKPDFNTQRFEEKIQPLRDGVKRHMLFETQHQRKNGTCYPVEVNLQLAKEDPPVFVAIIQDITERKEMLHALRESEERFQTLARVSPVGIFQTDTAGQCLYVNQRWCTIAGQDAEQAMGDGWANALHPLDRERVFTEWQASAENNTPFQSEYRFKKSDGTFAWVYGQATAVHDEQGELTGYVGTITDINERKQAEQELLDYKLHLEDKVEQRTDELKQINRELEAFSYSVSHDLRAPLRGIDGFSQALMEDYADKLDATASDYLNRIRASTQRMGNLIDDLLMLSRTTRGDMKFDETDLSVLVNSVIEELRHAEPERQVEVKISQGVRAMGDRRLLFSVFQNLLGNAWKFTRTQEHPVIEFACELQGDYITCHIKDNGAGFNMKYADKLFGVFQRLHAEKEYQGTGVGLAIVQRIIHRHGGKVWAEAKEGKGASFFFTLPAVVDDSVVAS
jgi:PAS domain S-box-containing protein